MTRTLHDAVTVQNIPSDATMVAGYVDGRYQTVPQLRQRFPKARLVTITVLGTNLDAHVVDIEAGDCTPQSGVAWAARKLAAGKGHPTLYCNTSTLPAVRAEVHRQGLDGKVSYWVAEYPTPTPGNPQVPAGAVAWQYTNKALGRSLDASVVAAFWPGVDPNPIRPRIFYPGLRPGATGKWVALAQHDLNVHDPALQLVVDGQYGPATRAAVDRFKRRRGWPADGVIGWRVWKALT